MSRKCELKTGPEKLGSTSKVNPGYVVRQSSEFSDNFEVSLDTDLLILKELMLDIDRTRISLANNIIRHYFPSILVRRPEQTRSRFVDTC